MKVRPPRWSWPRFVLILLGVVALLYRLRVVLLLFILALFLTYLIEPLVVALQRRGAPRDAAVLSVFLIAVLLAVSGVALLLPALTRELGEAVKTLPGYLQDVGRMAARLESLSRRLHLPAELRAIGERLLTRARLGMERLLGAALAALIGFLPDSFSLLLVPVIAYYLSRDYPLAVRRLSAWLAACSRPDLLPKLAAVDRTLRLYFRALSLELLATTVLLVIGLSLLRLEFALLFGVMAGIFNIIPYFGPLLGAVPAVLFASARSPWRAVYVIFLFLAVNQFEASVLIPRLVGRRVGLHPLLVIFSLLAGGELFGLPGLILA
ncbi:MAG: AI-2E family transporter, partial [Firmicutes bacterium]|nr:AI-2E family transporter [Bacillota bacterium]